MEQTNQESHNKQRKITAAKYIENTFGLKENFKYKELSYLEFGHIIYHSSKTLDNINESLRIYSDIKKNRKDIYILTIPDKTDYSLSCKVLIHQDTYKLRHQSIKYFLNNENHIMVSAGNKLYAIEISEKGNRFNLNIGLLENSKTINLVSINNIKCGKLNKIRLKDTLMELSNIVVMYASDEDWGKTQQK